MNNENDKKNSNILKSKFSNGINNVRTFYRDLYKKYGYSLAAVTIPKGAQDARFMAKFEIGDLHGTRILDVGCGFGHMLDYIETWGINAQYTGIDICPEFLEVAKQRHPGADFRLLNILEDPIDEQWDWVFLVGALNDELKNEHWWDYIREMIKRMYEMCIKGTAVDFLTTYVDFQKENAFHASPEKVFAFAKTLTRRVSLRHDYMAYEFTVYLYKNQSLTNNNIFFEFKKTLPPEPNI
jgi:SAM-dependent methyltransferase